MLINCPHCQTQLEAEKEHAGMTANCPQCNGEFIVPAEPPESAAVPPEEAAPGSVVPIPCAGRFYRSSGKCSLPRLILGVDVALLLVFVLAVIYSYATHYIPFIYLNALFTIGLGVAIGFIGIFMNVWGRNRNRILAFAGVCLVAVLALWFTWGFWVTTIFKDLKLFSVNTLLSMHPKVIAAVAGEVMKEEGYMNIGRFGHGNGLPLTGYALLILWILEAALIVGLALWIFLKSYRSMSFCEKCGNWTGTLYTSPALEVVEDENAFREQLIHGDSDALKNLRKRNPGVNYTQYSIDGCPCGETLLLTVSDVTVSFNSKDEASTSESPFVKDLYITPQTAEELSKRK